MKQRMRRQILAAISVAALLPLLCFAEPKDGNSTTTLAIQIDNSIYGQVARIYKLDPILIYAVTLTASGRQLGDSIGPSTNLITVNGKRHYFADRSAASAFLTKQLGSNQRNIAVGLAQINIQTFPNDPQMLLDPFFNLVEAARLLDQMQKSTDDYFIGIGRFFTWSDDAKLWGDRVTENYKRIVFSSNIPIKIASRE